MIRAAGGAAALLLTLGGLAAGAGATLRDAATALGRPLAATAGVRISAHGDHGVDVSGPPGSAVLAVVAGAVSTAAGGGVTLTGTGDDTGLVVTYTPLPPPSAASSRLTVARGAVLGHLGAAPAGTTLTLAVTLDGEPLDAAPLLRAAVDGALAALAGGAFVRPVSGATVTQPFGCTPYAFEPRDPACPSGHVHTGIDLAAPEGTPVRATLSGTVHVALDAAGYGLHVVIEHGNGLSTLYGHLSRVDVPDGAVVSTGETIGAVGSTGNSTGPHLHFEVRRGGIPENPLLDVALP